MRSIKSLTILSILTLTAVSGFAFNGDMGLSTEPLTDGSSDYPYLIEDFADFQVFTDEDNASIYWTAGVYTRMMTNIDFNPDKDGRVISYCLVVNYYGHFNGNSHKVQNLTIDGLQGGFISNLFGTVENLGIENISYKCTRLSGGIAIFCKNGSMIKNCFTTGTVTSGDGYGGGIAGNIDGGTISNSYSNCDIAGSSFSGGIAGYAKNSWVDNCHSTGDVTISSSLYQVYCGGLIGSTFQCTISNCFSTGNITNLNSNNGNIQYLTSGGLVGRNYRYSIISNCYASGIVRGGLSTGGLVGYNIDSEIISSSSSGEVYGNGIAGGLVGLNSGLIDKCSSSCQVESHESKGYTHDFGGLVGRNGEQSGTITPSISRSYATGDVNVRDEIDYYFSVGGLIGNNFGVISDCYATGDVELTSQYINSLIGGFVGVGREGSIENCYSTGTTTRKGVQSHFETGGFGASIYTINCFWDVETSVMGNPGDVVFAATGKITSEMQSKATFTDAGWDFEGIWGIGEGRTYPYLRQYIAADINEDNVVNLFDLQKLAENWLEY